MAAGAHHRVECQYGMQFGTETHKTKRNTRNGAFNSTVINTKQPDLEGRKEIVGYTYIYIYI